MPDIIAYFGPLELAGAAGLLILLAIGTAWIAWRRAAHRRRQRLLDSLPYPALVFHGRHPRAHNSPGADWLANLDVQAIAADALTRRQTVVRTIPAVEGQSFQARAVALSRGEVMVLLEDLAAAQRQQAFYRNFIQNVSHELKTPLTVIQGHAARLGDVPGDTESWQASRRIIADEGKRLTQLVDNLLTLARLESPAFSLDLAPLHLSGLLEEAILQVSDLAEARQIGLSLNLAPGLPRLDGDRARLKQVVLNLLDNALKYTPPGGSVVVSARLGEGAEAAHLVCAVQDTGEGIPVDDLPYIFEKLYRARRARGRPVEGSGLGLTIAQQIIRAHGGDLRVETAVGHGTTFTFTLPVKP